MLIDVGAETNGAARGVFTDPRVYDFRERLARGKSSAARAFATALPDMPMYRFFMLFGLNPAGMHAILDESEAKEGDA